MIGIVMVAVWLSSWVACRRRARGRGYGEWLFGLLGLVMGPPGFLLTLVATDRRLPPAADRQRLRLLTACAPERIEPLLSRTHPYLVLLFRRALQTGRVRILAEALVQYLDIEERSYKNLERLPAVVLVGFVAAVGSVFAAVERGWALPDTWPIWLVLGPAVSYLLLLDLGALSWGPVAIMRRHMVTAQGMAMGAVVLAAGVEPEEGLVAGCATEAPRCLWSAEAVRLMGRADSISRVIHWFGTGWFLGAAALALAVLMQTSGFMGDVCTLH